MKTIRSLLYFVAGALFFTACSKRISHSQIRQPSIPFRVIGYMLRSDMVIGKADNFDFSEINYLNIAFLNPDTSGVFKAQDSLNTIIQLAHKQHVKVFASIGGGAAPAWYATLLTPAHRAAFISNLVQLTTKNNLDGIDVDLEGEHIDTNYEAFVTDLQTALKHKDKMLTAAVATVYASRYTDKALRQFDFMSIMSYDKTGPWRPELPGQHAPYSMAVDDINYWTVVRHLPREKLNLGLPFYGYGFGKGAPEDISYKKLINCYPVFEYADSVQVAAGGIIYYNGLSTIKRKTKLALKQAGGVMIWELKQDTSGGKSLLRAINKLIPTK